MTGDDGLELAFGAAGRRRLVRLLLQHEARASGCPSSTGQAPAASAATPSRPATANARRSQDDDGPPDT